MDVVNLQRLTACSRKRVYSKKAVTAIVFSLQHGAVRIRPGLLFHLHPLIAISVHEIYLRFGGQDTLQSKQSGKQLRVAMRVEFLLGLPLLNMIKYVLIINILVAVCVFASLVLQDFAGEPVKALDNFQPFFLAPLHFYSSDYHLPTMNFFA